MPKFDVYRNLDGEGFLLDVQSDLLDDLNTRIVVPLLPFKKAPVPAKRLNPMFTVQDAEYVMATQFMAAVSKSILKRRVTDLSGKADEITHAIDMVFFGF